MWLRPGRGLLIPLGYLHPGKCEHSEVQSTGAKQGVVKHGRGNGYGAPDLCVMQVPPAYIVFCSNSSALMFSVVFMFASFSFQIQEKTQEKDKLKTIYSGFWDSLYYYMCSGDKSP